MKRSLRPKPGRAMLLVASVLAACGGDSGPSAPDTTPAQVIVAPGGPVAFTSLGDTLRLTATVKNGSGETLAGVPVTWSTQSASVVSISASGLSEAVGTGTSTIRAAAGNIESNAVTLTVTQAVSTVVIAGPALLTFSIGADTARLTATARDARGAPIPAAGVTWQSSAPAFATVDNTGLVKGLLRGSAIITARSGAIQSAAGVTAQVLSPAAEIRVTASPNTTAPVLETADFNEAIALLVPGGTIRVANGDYVVEDVTIERPLTVEAEGDAVVIRNTAGETSFLIDGISAGDVVLRGLRFDNSSPGDGRHEGFRLTEPDLNTTHSVRVQGTFAAVLVDDAEFTASPTVNGGIRILASTQAGASVTIRNTAFTGGLEGVFTGDVAGFPERDALTVIEGGSFRDSRFGVDSRGNSLVIRDVTFESCTFCVWTERFHNIDALAQPRTVDLSENVMLACARICAGIRGYNSEILENNFLMAPGAGGPRVTLQLVQDTGGAPAFTAVITGNRMENCGFVLCVGVFGSEGTPTVTLADNTIAARATDDLPQSGNPTVFWGTASMLMKNNDLTRCGTGEGICVYAYQSASSILENKFAIGETDDVTIVVYALGGTTLATDNQITGTSTITDPNDLSRYAAQFGFFSTNGGVLTMRNNALSNVAVGYAVNTNSAITGTGNSLSTTYIAASSVGALNLNEGNITGYVEAFSVMPDITSLRCNWWGSAAGPTAVPAGTAEVVYTPWRTAPIGDTSGACSGSSVTHAAPPAAANAVRMPGRAAAKLNMPARPLPRMVEVN